MRLTSLLSDKARREYRELNDPGHPRQMVSPEAELERVDAACEAAGRDEHKTCFCDDTHPKPPSPKEEGVTSVDGSRQVDIQRDTPPVEVELDLVPEDTIDVGFDELNDPIEEDLGL